MTVHHLLTRKPPEPTDPVPAGTWRTVATFDWRDPAAMVGKLETSLTADQQLAELKSLKAARYVHVMGYANVLGNLAAGVFAADWALRFLRVGTTDDTGLQSQPVCVPPARAGGTFPAHFATPHWFGKNPGGMILQVRHLAGFFDVFQVDTRDVKVEWHT